MVVSVFGTRYRRSVIMCDDIPKRPGWGANGWETVMNTVEIWINGGSVGKGGHFFGSGSQRAGWQILIEFTRALFQSILLNPATRWLAKKPNDLHSCKEQSSHCGPEPVHSLNTFIKPYYYVKLFLSYQAGIFQSNLEHCVYAVLLFPADRADFQKRSSGLIRI